MCRARSTTLTGSNGAQGLWSEYTAKPQLAAPKGEYGPGPGVPNRRSQPAKHPTNSIWAAY